MRFQSCLHMACTRIFISFILSKKTVAMLLLCCTYPYFHNESGQVSKKIHSLDLPASQMAPYTGLEIAIHIHTVLCCFDEVSILSDSLVSASSKVVTLPTHIRLIQQTYHALHHVEPLSFFSIGSGPDAPMESSHG